MLISSSVEPPPRVTPRAGTSPEAVGLPQRLQVQQGEKIPQTRRGGVRNLLICWALFLFQLDQAAVIIA